MNPTSEYVEDAGLRERRRRQTAREIADAALELFQERGVAGTTVEDIARSAGISPRTFFRYFAAKEDAVLRDDLEGRDRFEERVEVALSLGGSIAEGYELARLQGLEDFDTHVAVHERAMRVRSLVLAEPALLVRILTHETEDGERLLRLVRDTTGTEASATDRAVFAVVGTLVRVAVDQWALQREAGVAGSVAEHYRRLRGGLAGHVSGELGAGGS